MEIPSGKIVRVGTEELEVWPDRCVNGHRCIQCLITGKIKCAPRFWLSPPGRVECIKVLSQEGRTPVPERHCPSPATRLPDTQPVALPRQPVHLGRIFIPIGEKPPQPWKITKHDIAEMIMIVNSFKPMPEAQGEAHKNAFFRHLGRPRTLPQRYCKGCNQAIYPRPYRVREGGGNYCRRCFNELFCPPLRTGAIVPAPSKKGAGNYPRPQLYNNIARSQTLFF